VTQAPPRFAAVVWDVDSTLTRVEGVEWLAERRGDAIAAAVAAMTTRAMDGTVALDAVYGERLALVRPTRADVAALADAYAASAVAGAREALAALRAAGLRLAIVSGGVRQAVLPFAEVLGFTDRDVYAVALQFAADGSYTGFDAASPLARRGGKPAVVSALGLPRPILAIGDGSTDAELKPCVAAFAAFTGVARRESVVAVADYVITQFAELPALVL
jgi:phosphoserine phosphatase